MKKNKIQYAKPIKVSDINNAFNADKGIAGYNVEVKFKGLTNIPCPHCLNFEDLHMYQDITAETSRVVYYFPFVGHGVINWGKLAAKHWANKMRKQINPADLEPLYELHNGKNMEHICNADGKMCEIATKHFQNFKNFIDDCAENKSTRTISTQEINCCMVSNCRVWQNYVAKLKEKIK